MTSRRQVVIALGAGALTASLPSLAQQANRASARIGFLSGLAPTEAREFINCFLRGLKGSGWVEGQNTSIDFRFGGGSSDQHPALADELIRLRPDLIVVTSTPATQAVHRATSTIPVVMIAVSNPVASGIVASLARPGGNVTGVSNFLPATSGKLLELLKMASPRVSRVGVLYNPCNQGKGLEMAELRAAANDIGVLIEPLEVRSSSDFEGAFLRITESRCDALVVLHEAVTFAVRSRIVEFAKTRRLATAFQIREYVEVGGLMSYGLNYCDHYRSAATYVDKILRGARPADLPIQLPTTFELTVNRNTAKAIGITIPKELLLRADEVIG